MNYKFRGHESFFIRKGWIYKGMKNVKNKPDIFVAKDRNPMDILGIGANMVRSLRYWLQAINLTQEPEKGKRIQKFTKLGEIIWSKDPYIEEPGTIALLHYKLVTNEKYATSWYYFYNKFNMSEFNKEDFIYNVSNYAKIRYGVEIAESSLSSDFDCIINTYVSRLKSRPEKVHPENNIDSPFGELGLVDIIDKKHKIYKKCIPSKDVLHPLIVLSVIVDQANGKNEFKISSLLSDYCNVGKVFNLDIISLINYLYKIQMLGYLKVIRTSGLDIVKLNTKMNFYECIEKYYDVIDQ